MKIKYALLLLIITLLLTSTTIIAQPPPKGNCNLEVILKPGRYILPHVYAEAKFATFEVTVMNHGPETSDNYTLNFHIKELLSPTPGISYDQTWYEGSLNANQGRGHPITIRCVCSNTLLSIYRAQASIDINDNKILDNIATFHYIVLEN